MRDSSCGFSFHGGKTKLAREMLNAVTQMHTFCEMHAQKHAQIAQMHAQMLCVCALAWEQNVS